MAMIASKPWQMDKELEKALSLLLRMKRGSKLLKKRYFFVFIRFSFFVADHWQKRLADVDLNDYKLSDEVQEELDEYRVPYSYFA